MLKSLFHLALIPPTVTAKKNVAHKYIFPPRNLGDALTEKMLIILHIMMMDFMFPVLLKWFNVFPVTRHTLTAVIWAFYKLL